MYISQQRFEDTEGVIKFRKSTKDRQYNGQRKGGTDNTMAKEKGEQTNEGQTIQWPKKTGNRQMKDRQNTTQKLKNEQHFINNNPLTRII